MKEPRCICHYEAHGRLNINLDSAVRTHCMKQLMDWVSALVVQHNVESFESAEDVDTYKKSPSGDPERHGSEKRALEGLGEHQDGC